MEHELSARSSPALLVTPLGLPGAGFALMAKALAPQAGAVWGQIHGAFAGRAPEGCPQLPATLCQLLLDFWSLCPCEADSECPSEQTGLDQASQSWAWNLLF